MRQNAHVFGQEPGSALPPQAPALDAPPAGEVVAALQHLGWVDATALTVLGVFFVLGLFKGIVWQASRVLILAAAYTLAVRFGPSLSETLVHWTHTGPMPPSEDEQLTAFYIACVLVFVGVLVGLSLLALVLMNLVKKAGLGFYDRLFGGLTGVASGAGVVLLLLTAVYMFFPQSNVAAAARQSHSLKFSQQAVGWLGELLPEQLRRVFPSSADPADAANPAGLPAGHPAANRNPASPADAVPAEASGTRRESAPNESAPATAPQGGDPASPRRGG